MITVQELTAMVGCAAYTQQGQRVGGVDYVLVDDTTGRPEWVRITDSASGLGGVFVPLRHAALEDQRLVLPYAVSLIEQAPCAALDCDRVLSVAQEQKLFAHYGIRDAREEVNAEPGAGWGQMDRAGAIREGAAGQETHVSRLRAAQPGQ
ncbi:PRC-barrel domain-containing protein [Streptomyces sp. H27-H1]|uniref:PRC-barrel domain-containing protein n=1 Tax=Streptomyces sp. H27-H1 TaxID=2996461 RepID=UPI00226E96CE|nr:PRC-barrel domain-containing protein [Streptomyces sp. H27-H1]MCY0932416.1 PRC-barrel domain-containing protein [Streptomyces sp. H27-H1]